LVLLVLGGVAPPAQGQVKLAWKFDDKKPFYVLNKMTLKMAVDVQSMAMKHEQTTTTLASFQVKEKQGDNTVLEQKIEFIQIKSPSGGLGTSVDKLTEQLQGLTFTITLDPKGHVVKFAGYEALLAKLTANDAAKLIRQTLTEEALKRGAEETFGFLPEGALEKGKKWHRDATAPMGALGTFKTKTTYSYLGKTSEGEEIGVEASLTYTPPKGEAGADLPFKILKGDLRAESAKGTIIFNASAGRLVRYNLNLLLKGSLTLEVTGNPVPLEVTQEQQHFITVSEKKPVVE
jgi:hypothetical protein